MFLVGMLAESTTNNFDSYINLIELKICETVIALFKFSCVETLSAT